MGLTSGMVIGDDVYSSTIGFYSEELTAEISILIIQDLPAEPPHTHFSAPGSLPLPLRGVSVILRCWLQ